MRKKNSLGTMIKNPLIEAISMKNRIGLLYNRLVEAQSDDLEIQNEKWKLRLNCEGTPLQDSIDMADTILLSANLRAQHYKTIFHLYYTPAMIAKWRGKQMVNVNAVGVNRLTFFMYFFCARNSDRL